LLQQGEKKKKLKEQLITQLFDLIAAASVTATTTKSNQPL
jgi:hypothetical protein